MHTDSIIINTILFVVGLAILVKGSGWFIDGAAFIARRMNVPDAIIGLTLVSIGTSLPELATNVVSAAQGKPEMAMGVIPGSNIANILLVLGLSVFCLKTVKVTTIMFSRDVLVMIISFVVFVIMCYAFPMTDGRMGLTRIEAGILLIGFFAYVFKLLKQNKGDVTVEAEAEDDTSPVDSIWKAVLALSIGGAMVVLGSKLMVDNVVWIAEVKLKISPEIVAATIVAVGTSVPELAVTFAGILKKKSDIALGNIVGSSIFNLIFVMGVTGLVAEVPVTADVATLILPFMMGSGILLVGFMYSGMKLKRWEGGVMTSLFIVYIALSILKSMGRLG